MWDRQEWLTTAQLVNNITCEILTYFDKFSESFILFIASIYFTLTKIFDKTKIITVALLKPSNDISYKI